MAAGPKPKFRIIKGKKNDSIKTMYRTIVLDHSEIMMNLDRERNKPYFLEQPYKCSKCIIVYMNKACLLQHNKKYHSKVAGRLQCDICGVFRRCKVSMEAHCKEHYTKYKCLLCDQECKNKGRIYFHMKKHRDARIHECASCGLRYSGRVAFYKHYRQMHKTFICDYCQKVCKKKQKLIIHIRKTHDTPTCHICKKTYARWSIQRYHMRRIHSREVSEASFCVECNAQFGNVYHFKEHLLSSSKHKRVVVAKSFKCPECPKVYTKNQILRNHMNYVHLNKSKYCCEKCDKYFLSSTPLRSHMRRIHEKRPLPKNRLCTICGRGFTDNLILKHHIRTHTGERPHECPHCPAKFAQKVAMRTHVKAIHMKHKQAL